ncbi:MAG: aminoglycoside 6-N-acetyltransferase [Symbiobacteriaceae bacterium]|jgi:aminoglycoside 6'-N-acetyltransferase|nr:aminoglycoside 6-N-acetyltransferase [Symbiobacteriaceae bacterium]
MADFSISFRSLTMEDLPRMLAWVNQEPLLQIWNHGKTTTLEELEAKYAPRIRGEESVSCYTILLDGEPIGYIQGYLWRDYPEYSQHMGLTEESASLDVFIGDASNRGRGVGTKMLVQFMRELIFNNPEVASCIITPEVANVAAHRAYEKAGFRHWKTMEHPDEPTPVYFMRVGRDELPAM